MYYVGQPLLRHIFLAPQKLSNLHNSLGRICKHLFVNKHEHFTKFFALIGLIPEKIMLPPTPAWSLAVQADFKKLVKWKHPFRSSKINSLMVTVPTRDHVLGISRDVNDLALLVHSACWELADFGMCLEHPMCQIVVSILSNKPVEEARVGRSSLNPWDDLVRIQAPIHVL